MKIEREKYSMILNAEQREALIANVQEYIDRPELRAHSDLPIRNACINLLVGWRTEGSEQTLRLCRLALAIAKGGRK